MKLYVFSQSCTRGGRIAGEDLLEDEINGDMDLWGEGSEEELIAQARERLSKRFDARPGGAGDAFAHKCARNVLAYFGADEDDDTA